MSIAKEISADGVKITTTDFYNKALINEALGSFWKIFITIGGIPIEDVDLMVVNLAKDFHNKIFLIRFKFLL